MSVAPPMRQHLPPELVRVDSACRRHALRHAAGGGCRPRRYAVLVRKERCSAGPARLPFRRRHPFRLRHPCRP
eukprot:5977337-Pleurochrysis_carterae.AAC.1